jgi:hypothetical protein
MDNRCLAVFRELRSAVSVELGGKWKHQPELAMCLAANCKNGISSTSFTAVSVNGQRLITIPRSLEEDIRRNN